MVFADLMLTAIQNHRRGALRQRIIIIIERFFQPLPTTTRHVVEESFATLGVGPHQCFAFVLGHSLIILRWHPAISAIGPAGLKTRYASHLSKLVPDDDGDNLADQLAPPLRRHPDPA